MNKKSFLFIENSKQSILCTRIESQAQQKIYVQYIQTRQPVTERKRLKLLQKEYFHLQRTQSSPLKSIFQHVCKQKFHLKNHRRSNSFLFKMKIGKKKKQIRFSYENIETTNCLHTTPKIDKRSNILINAKSNKIWKVDQKINLKLIGKYCNRCFNYEISGWKLLAWKHQVSANRNERSSLITTAFGRSWFACLSCFSGVDISLVRATLSIGIGSSTRSYRTTHRNKSPN